MPNKRKPGTPTPLLNSPEVGGGGGGDSVHHAASYSTFPDNSAASGARQPPLSPSGGGSSPHESAPLLSRRKGSFVDAFTFLSGGHADTSDEGATGGPCLENLSPRFPRHQKGVLKPKKFQMEVGGPMASPPPHGALSRKTSVHSRTSRGSETSRSGVPSNVSDDRPVASVDARTGSYTFLVEGLDWRFTALSVPFYYLVQLRWWKLLCLMVCVFIAVNVLFASLFYAPCAVASAARMAGLQGWEGGGMSLWVDGEAGTPANSCDFQMAFEFSVETIATIGYGEMQPHGHYNRGLVFCEALMSMFVLPCITAIVISKLNQARRLRHTVVFSQSAVVNSLPVRPGKAASAPTEHPTLSFRIASLLNKHHPMDVRVNLFLIQDKSDDPYTLPDIEVTEISWLPTFQEGKREKITGYATLPAPYLALPCTIFHELDETSPLHGYRYEDFVATCTEIIVIVEAVDYQTQTPVGVKQSYGPKNIVFDAAWDPSIVTLDPETRRYKVDLTRFDTVLSVAELFQEPCMQGHQPSVTVAVEEPSPLHHGNLRGMETVRQRLVDGASLPTVASAVRAYEDLLCSPTSPQGFAEASLTLPTRRDTAPVLATLPQQSRRARASTGDGGAEEEEEEEEGGGDVCEVVGRSEVQKRAATARRKRRGKGSVGDAATPASSSGGGGGGSGGASEGAAIKAE